jgi:hypothetical protein
MEVLAECDFGAIHVTTVNWPIILIEFPEKRVPDEALLSTLAYLESLWQEAVRRHEKLFMITDLTKMREVTPANQRRATAEWMKRNVHLGAVASVGGATVTPSAILRGIITAVYWVQPPTKPMFAVATRREAVLKGIQMLKAENVPVPRRVLELNPPV